MRRDLLKSKAFIRCAKRLVKRNSDHVAALRGLLDALEKDAFEPRLRTHKLSGDLDGYWAASGGYDLRVVFKFVDDNGTEAILLLNAGTHDEVY